MIYLLLFSSLYMCLIIFTLVMSLCLSCPVPSYLVLSFPIPPHPPCSCIHLRIFSHPNVLPVLGACQSPPAPHPVIITHWMPYGSLYNVLHEGTSEYCVESPLLQLLVSTQVLAWRLVYVQNLSEMHAFSFTMWNNVELAVRIEWNQ